MATIEIIKAGIQTSIQDGGCRGQMQNGIAPSGAMDPLAMNLANSLLSKSIDSAVLEITLTGPTLKFNSSLQIAICGALFDCCLNGKNISNNETIQVEAGDVVEFKQLKNGARAYMAFSGELQADQFSGSHSTNLTCAYGGLSGRTIKAGDTLEILNITQSPEKTLPTKFQPFYSNHLQLRVTAGVEEKWFREDQIKLFHSQTYEVKPASNRMGIRLNSQPIQQLTNNHLVSSGIVQGTIQIPPKGQPIITSVEGQTIGGYPRIANVIQADLHLLGQLKSHSRIDFLKVSLDKSQILWKEKNALLNELFKQ